MPNHPDDFNPSRTTCLAAGLFAHLADCVERGRAVEAIDTHKRLSSLGYIVNFRRPRKARRAASVMGQGVAS